MKNWAFMVFLLLGIVLIAGTYCNVKFIVDPPENWSPYYSSAWLKKTFGVKFLKIFNYIFGFFLVVFSIILLP